MPFLSQSFLQALGWATINSLWQVGLLWCFFLLVDALFKLSSRVRFQWAVASSGAGFVLFTITLIHALFSNTASFIFIEKHLQDFALPVQQQVLMIISYLYLLFLVIPVFFFYKNWRFTQELRTHQHYKVPVNLRLYVQKIAAQLHIHKKVQIWFSGLVKSPLTIGFFKPVILLPIAVVNHLSVQQVEAILLHELSHIKRCDYLINIFIKLAETFLYFNPFIKMFVKVAEQQREECCDAAVIQYGYDKLNYAYALMHLQKSVKTNDVFVMGAIGKNPLLTRIQKLLNVYNEPAKAFVFANIVSKAFSAILLILLTHLLVVPKSALLINKEERNAYEVYNPFTLSYNHPRNTNVVTKDSVVIAQTDLKKFDHKITDVSISDENKANNGTAESHKSEPGDVVFTAYSQPSIEQQIIVKATINATKQVLQTSEWKDVENEFADLLTNNEKERAKVQYLKMLEKVNWVYLENKLLADFEKYNWNDITKSLHKDIELYKIDSLQSVYSATLQLIKSVKYNDQPSLLPFPDESLQSIHNKEMKIRYCLDSINQVKDSSIIKL